MSRHPQARLLATGFLLLVCHCFPASAQIAGVPRVDPQAPVLTTARQVARFASLDPNFQPAVRLEAVVSFASPSGTVFLADESGATFFNTGNKSHNYHPGQRLAIQGVRHTGLYIGGIRPTEITVIGEAPVPAARARSFKELATGDFHYELAEIEGVVRSLDFTGDSTAVARLQMEGGILGVRFDRVSPDASRWIDALVRVRGLAAGAINHRRQIVEPYLEAEAPEALTIVEPSPEDPFTNAEVTLSSLTRFASSGGVRHRVKISGVALSPILEGNLFVRGEGGSVRVRTEQVAEVRPGANVEIVGFPEMGPFSAQLSDAIFRVTGSGNSAPSPLAPDPGKPVDGSLDGELVTLDAEVVQDYPGERAILAKTEKVTFRVVLPDDSGPRFSPGSRVRFSGIHVITAAESDNYTAKATRFELWLRGPGDAVLLSSPPWWNARKLAVALALAATAALAALAWAAMLRHQVARQVRVIEGKTQREAMVEERHRIAREFHDTLEQELAGLSIRLDAALPRVKDEKALSLVDQSRRLLAKLQVETREFIWDLRDDSRHDQPLEKSFHELVEHLRATTAIPLELVVDSDLPPISAMVRHQLSRIAREAIHNAIKYAVPGRIAIRVLAAGEGIRLTVEDDGCGFNPALAPAGHFGLQGMRERARKIGAKIEIESSPGNGTRVEVVLA